MELLRTVIQSLQDEGESQTARLGILEELVQTFGLESVCLLKRTLTALQRRDYVLAGHEFMNSYMARRMGRDAHRIRSILITGDATAVHEHPEDAEQELERNN